MVEKTKTYYSFVNFNKQCYSTIASFDFWMSKHAHNNFEFVVSFLGSNWHAYHYWIIWCNWNIKSKIDKKYNKRFRKNGLKKNIIADLKDKDSNFNSTTTPFKYVVNSKKISS